MIATSFFHRFPLLRVGEPPVRLKKSSSIPKKRNPWELAGHPTCTKAIQNQFLFPRTAVASQASGDLASAGHSHGGRSPSTGGGRERAKQRPAKQHRFERREDETLQISSYRTSGSVRQDPPNLSKATCLSVEHITGPQRVAADP